MTAWNHDFDWQHEHTIHLDSVRAVRLKRGIGEYRAVLVGTGIESKGSTPSLALQDLAADLMLVAQKILRETGYSRMCQSCGIGLREGPVAKCESCP